MPKTVLNGVELYWERTGQTGDALVLVHGSWVDHHSWDAIVPALARSFRVVTYDRRGHSQSERPSGPGRITDDVSDLAALIEHLSLSPSHILGNSLGAVMALRLAAEKPGLVRSLLLHDPALFRMFQEHGPHERSDDSDSGLQTVFDLIAAGQTEAGAQHFVEAVIKSGRWQDRPQKVRDTWIFNAPTFLDEQRDPETGRVDFQRLTDFTAPVLLTAGEKSPPVFRFRIGMLARMLSKAQTKTLAGAGHGPHLTHPAEYVDTIVSFLRDVVVDCPATSFDRMQAGG